ncbi:CopC domain containing protein [Candidatus Nanopelagicaceae bacterium]|jgi:methionine-rich copper-binding protein CopC
MKRILGIAMASLLMVNTASIAEAHSTLVSSIPKSGTTLGVVPNLVTLTFNEKLLVIPGEQPNSLTVANSSGQSITTGPLKINGSKISITLKSKKSTGKFTVAYRVVSADGHPISGKYFFTVK